jgi:dTDP-4-amino-4,6-dideoxygalactose transaminase
VHFELSSANLAMSRPSRWVLGNTDLGAVVEQRRLNYIHLLKATASLPGIAPFAADLPDGVCPMAFPFHVEQRTDLHLELQAAGIPAFTWDGVVHPSFSATEFPGAARLYRQLVWLPVHQSLDGEDLDRMIEALARALMRDA